MVRRRIVLKKTSIQPADAKPVLRQSWSASTDNPSGKAEHGTSPLTAFRNIRELIVSGRMSPGSRIIETDLAERLNMSRTPVRAAILWLQREGYVVEQRGVSKVGMIVAPLTKEDANQLYLIIGRMEGIAGRSAASFPKIEREALVKELTDLNDQLCTLAASRSNTGEIFDVDRSFHRVILNPEVGSRLSTLHEALEPQTQRYRWMYASSMMNNHQTSVDEHADIIAALRNGDPDKIGTSFQDHWRKEAERLSDVIAIFGERGSW